MPRLNIHPDGVTPISQSHLSAINSELGNTVTMVSGSARSATLKVKTDNALWALIGVIWASWVRRGISFDKVTALTKEKMVSISIADHPQKNRLITEFL